METEEDRKIVYESLFHRGFTESQISEFAFQDTCTVNAQKLIEIFIKEYVEDAPRVTTVLKPLKVQITNLESLDDENEVGYGVDNAEDVIYIDRNDENVKPLVEQNNHEVWKNKIIMLKNSFSVRCVSVNVDENGFIKSLDCSAVYDEVPHDILVQQWMNGTQAIPVQIRYLPLPLSERCNALEWSIFPHDQIITFNEALCEQSLLHWEPIQGKHFQLEGFGFFYCENESNSQLEQEIEHKNYIFTFVVESHENSVAEFIGINRSGSADTTPVISPVVTSSKAEDVNRSFDKESLPSSSSDSYDVGNLSPKPNSGGTLHMLNQANYSYTSSTPASGIINESPSDKLTVSQRREIKRLQEEREKKARLAAYIAKTPSIEENEDPTVTPELVSIKDRFANAKLMQQKKEEDRLNRIKNDPNKKLEKRSASVKDVWAESLNESKQKSQSRFLDTKKQTISQFRVTDGTGIVKKRIGEWEELFMQIAASLEELEETIRMALKKASIYSKKTSEEQMKLFLAEQKQFRENNLTIPEMFFINDTHIYNAKLLDSHIYSYIKKYVNDSKVKHYPLSTGVYGDSASHNRPPPIDVFATAMKSDDNNIYIAVTIKAVAGQELNQDVYGIKKIAVFDNNSGQNLFEKLVDIVPMSGWESWVEAGTYDSQINERILSDENNDSNDMKNSQSIINDIMEEEKKSVKQSLLADVDDEYEASKNSTNQLSSIKQENNLNKNDNDDDDDDKRDDSLTNVELDDVVQFDENSLLTGDNSTSIKSRPVIPKSALAAAAALSSNYSFFDENALDDDDDGVSRVQNSESLNMQSKSNESQDTSASSINDSLSNSTDANTKNNITPMKQGGTNADITNNNNVNTNNNTTPQRKPSVDSNVDENENDLEHVEDNDPQQPFNFGKTISIAKVGTARSFLPTSLNHRPDFGFSKMTDKNSWNLEDEIDAGLPTVQLAPTYFNLDNVRSFSVGSNCFIVEGIDSTTVFTGTLKSAVTETKYLLDNDKIFEWIRGAACSGWLTKWPMASQQFGRRSRRFFILRDNILSYYKTKPIDEEEALNSFSLNTLHLTDSTSIEITRYYLLRCIKITTPIDILWIRAKKEFSDEPKWVNEFNKSVKHQGRKKLFMTKLRVESIWYHESPAFSIVAVDSYNFLDRHVMIALFCYQSAAMSQPTSPVESLRRLSFYASPISDSVPIKGSLLYSIDIGTNESQRLQFEVLSPVDTTNLGTELIGCKVYGEVILFGGTGGFIGIGIIKRPKDREKTPPGGIHRLIMNCIPVPIPVVITTKENNSTKTINNSSTISNIHPNDSAIICFAIGTVSNIFIAGDDQNNISIWYYEKQNDIFNYTHTAYTGGALAAQTVVSPGKAAASAAVATALASGSLLPLFQSSINLSITDSSKLYNDEQINKMYFLPNDQYLIVSTSRRLLMFVGNFTQQINRDATDGTNENIRLKSWVEIDRALPGKCGVFALFVSETFIPLSPGASMAELRRKIIQWKILSDEDQNDKSIGVGIKKRVPGSPAVSNISNNNTAKRGSITASGGSSTAAPASNCKIYRFQWNDDMFEAVLAQMKDL
eukprot:gene9071-12233_t